MKNIVRIKGIIALIALLITGGLVFVVFADSIVKSLLESQLGKLNGAEVNIENVEISYVPLKLVVTGIEATDSNDVKKNFIALEKAVFDLDMHSLLMNKFIVNEMQLSEIKFGTERKVAGEIIKEVVEEVVEDKSDEPGFVASALNLPDSDELIKRAGLGSEAAFDEFNKKGDQAKISWESLKAWSDDKAKWDVYETRYKEIEKRVKKGSFKDKVNALKDLKQLNDEIKAELKVFQQRRDQFKKDYSELKVAYKNAKDAPAKDLEKIKKEYSFDSGNVENLSRLIFGDEIARYTALAKKYYDKVKPYLESDEPDKAVIERDEGKWIKFREYEPRPSFMIRHARLTIYRPDGYFKGEGTNIGNQQYISKKTSVLKLEGEALKYSNAESVRVEVDMREKKSSIIRMDYALKERRIEQFKVSQDKSLPVTMDKALLNGFANIVSTNGDLKGNAGAQFRKVNFTSSRAAKNGDVAKKLPEMIATSLTEIKDFDINAGVTGKVTSPKLKVDSDIDNKLNSKLKKQFDKVKQEYEKELKMKLEEKYGDKLKALETKLAEYKKVDDEIKAMQSKLDQKLGRYK